MNWDSALSTSKNRIEIPELISFLMITVVMLGSAALLIPSYTIFFLALVVIDGLSTYARVRLFVAMDRAVFALALILISSVLLNFSAIELILETLILIAILDFSLLLRRLHGAGDPLEIIKIRLQSYLFSVAPAGVFAVGMLYIYSIILFPSIPPSPVLEMGLASAGIFLAISYIVRTFVTSK